MLERLDADAYIRATKRLERSSGWKYETQRFLLNRLTEISALQKEVNTGCYKPQQGREFKIHENGHERIVRAMNPKDAVFQHAMSDEILIPELRKYLIHDNGASLKYKGLSFTRRRFEQHLRWYYQRYGRNGYALMIDFRKYFDNIRHDIALDLIKSKIHDENLLQIIARILQTYEIDVSYSDDPDIETKVFNSMEYQYISENLRTGKRIMRKSMGIGSQLSQIVGIFYPARIDSYCKTVKGIHCYDAYMDDRIILHPDKEFLQSILNDITKIANGLGIFINQKKTQIVKLSHGFTWLKTRYVLTKDGKIARRIPHDVVTRQRRKMKKLAELAAKGIINWQVFEQQYQSWRGSKRKYKAYHTLKKMDKLFKELKENGTEHKSNAVTDRHHSTSGES